MKYPGRGTSIRPHPASWLNRKNCRDVLNDPFRVRTERLRTKSPRRLRARQGLRGLDLRMQPDPWSRQTEGGDTENSRLDEVSTVGRRALDETTVDVLLANAGITGL